MSESKSPNSVRKRSTEKTSPKLPHKDSSLKDEKQTNNHIINRKNDGDSPKNHVNDKQATNSEAHKGHVIKDIFKPRPSLLSSEASAGSYRGFLNLGIILLVLTNSRLVVVNLMKYGILINFKNLSAVYKVDWYRWPGVLIGAIIMTFVFCEYFIEVMFAKKKYPEEKLKKIQLGNLAALLMIPPILVWNIDINPGSGIVVMLIQAVMLMKMVSYAFVNYNLRHNILINQANTYPNNLTLKNFIFFLLIPTCVYQLEYPRTEKIRKGWLIRRCLEAILLSALVLGIVEQYIIPLVHNSVLLKEENEIIRTLYLVERILKLGIPNLYVWLLGFYIFFHLYLNILAEILRFGDRLFYKDWWNSRDLTYFWSNWNMPVHTWMLSTIYIPLRQRGYSRTIAVFGCFLISAVFHELIIAVPFRMLKFWSFAGMIGQLPLMKISERFRDGQTGNIIFWFSIVLGQPFLVLMIYRDWYSRHYADALTSTISSLD